MLLIINSGSSSIKYKLFSKDPRLLVIAKGIIDRIGIRGRSQVRDHSAAIRLILDRLDSKVEVVAHRVVHGGEAFKGPVVIDKHVIKKINSLSRLAPLHNPPNLLGIKACKRFLPKAKQIAVFDTAYYQTLPEAAYLYAVPYELYKRFGIRKYGFHGTSHKYVAIKTAEALNRPLRDLKIITCHLGNGCSVTATKEGKAIDTSMGFTPLEGLVMGTRSGDIDPAIPLYLMKKGLSGNAIDDILNKRSGLLGVSGLSSDMRDIYRAVKMGNKKAKLAFDMFVKGIEKYIGAFAAHMNGVDAITFTGGIGENHAPTRRAVSKKLNYLNADILTIPTDEETMIARETKDLLKW